MADDAPPEQEEAAPTGRTPTARACDDRGGVTTQHTEGEWLLQRQHKEDEMITALLTLLARRTARNYLAAGCDDPANHAA